MATPFPAKPHGPCLSSPRPLQGSRTPGQAAAFLAVPGLSLLPLAQPCLPLCPPARRGPLAPALPSASLCARLGVRGTRSSLSRVLCGLAVSRWPLSHLSLEPSAPISGGLVSELSRSLLPGRALRWVPSVSSARPSRGPLPPASFPSPASLGLGLGGGGGGAGRGGRAGRGGAVTRGQPG